MDRDYEKIKRDIIDALYWDSRVDTTDVMVFVDQGRVRLTGVVPHYLAKRAAESAAWSVPQVNAVHNRIQVRYRQDEVKPTDDRMKANIENLFVWNPSIKLEDIKVGVSEGIVKLSGSVDHYWKRLMAEELAGYVEGVVEIINDIEIVPANRVLDKAIAERIRAVLAGHPQTRDAKIDVSVKRGRVQLKGTVTSQSAHHFAAKAALHISGVIDLDNRLGIRSESNPADHHLRHVPARKDPDTFQRLARAEDDGFPVDQMLDEEVVDYHG